MDTFENDNDDWTENDSLVAQALADFLETNVAGFAPHVAEKQTINNDIPYVPNFDIEIFRNNVPILQSIIISAFLHGSDREREYIADSIKPEHFWERSFRKYLFEIMLKQFRTTRKVSLENVQSSISQHSMLVYGEPETRRSSLGDHYTWAQIIRFSPTWKQVLDSIEKIKRLPKPEGY